MLRLMSLAALILVTLGLPAGAQAQHLHRGHHHRVFANRFFTHRSFAAPVVVAPVFAVPYSVPYSVPVASDDCAAAAAPVLAGPGYFAAGSFAAPAGGLTCYGAGGCYAGHGVTTFGLGRRVFLRRW